MPQHGGKKSQRGDSQAWAPSALPSQADAHPQERRGLCSGHTGPQLQAQARCRWVGAVRRPERLPGPHQAPALPCQAQRHFLCPVGPQGGRSSEQDRKGGLSLPGQEHTAPQTPCSPAPEALPPGSRKAHGKRPPGLSEAGEPRERGTGGPTGPPPPPSLAAPPSRRLFLFSF